MKDNTPNGNQANNRPSPANKLTREEYARLCHLRSTGALPPSAGNGANARGKGPNTSASGRTATDPKRPGTPAYAGKRRADNRKPPPLAHQPSKTGPHTHAASKRDEYLAYKLIGGLAVAAVVIIIIIIALFSGGARPAVQASTPGEGGGTVFTDSPDVTDHDSAASIPPATAGDDTYVICVDPGHGYDDPGAIYEQTMGGIPEKAVTLDVALMLTERLEAAGLTVIMTHSDDAIPADYSSPDQYTMDPFERVDFVKAHPEIDLFISLHCDAYTDDTSVGGTRIYYYNGGVDGTTGYTAALSEALGKALSIEVPIIGKDMAEAYYVTKMLSMPSVLIEMGFITNSDDAVNLLSDEWRNTFVAGAAQGILDYIAAQDE